MGMQIKHDCLPKQLHFLATKLQSHCAVKFDVHIDVKFLKPKKSNCIFGNQNVEAEARYSKTSEDVGYLLKAVKAQEALVNRVLVSMGV